MFLDMDIEKKKISVKIVLQTNMDQNRPKSKLKFFYLQSVSAGGSEWKIAAISDKNETKLCTMQDGQLVPNKYW